MSEETGDEKKPTAAKKTTTRRAPKKAASTSPKKTAPKKTTARKTATAKAAAAKSTTKTTTSKPKAVRPQATKPATATPTPEEQTGDTAMNSEQTSQETGQNSNQILDDLKSRDWPQIIKRALLMFFFGVLGSAALWIAFFLAATQVVFTIFAGETNPSLTRIVKQLANFIHDVLDYLSFASDETPFPFERKWPDAD